MSNLTVDDCEGFLLDSDNGDLPNTYDHNENYTFSICIEGDGVITMEFIDFCTEENFDSLRIYDGPDTLSNQLGMAYSGEIDPPTIEASSGCLTLNFISDPNVTCTGWIAHWYVDLEEPAPPPISPIPNLPCESGFLQITFAEFLPCDSLYAGAFSITGPQFPTITSVQTPFCTEGFTNTVQLFFEPPISRSGNYEINFVSYQFDACGTLYELLSQGNFAVVDCPLNVVLTSEIEPLCEGLCTVLTAEPNGGNPASYTYSWGPILSNQSSVFVCPLETTTYYITLTDGVGATVVDSIVLEVVPNPVISIEDTSFCQSLDTFVLSATPLDGLWSGNGINEDNASTGLYYPALVSGQLDTVIYTDENGCADQIIIEIKPHDIGDDDASCPGADSFYVSGGFPLGGMWTGENIDPDGLFHPTDTIGAFEVTYIHPNGCTASKTVFVGEIELPEMDTLCQSDGILAIPVSPIGGVWEGSGIVDSLNGLFDTRDALIGDNLLLYNINGCTDSIRIFVKQIDALWDFSVCPDQPPVVVPGNWTPAGGVWSGVGIVDPATGLYDPSILPNWSVDTLRYLANGCTDTRLAYVVQTIIGLDEQLLFCQSDEPFELNRESVGNLPPNGNWSGTGIVFSDDQWFFVPSLASPGEHTLIYTANTCSDEIQVEVLPLPVIAAEILCEEENPVFLQTDSQGGLWSGPGIINNTEGVFDPALVGTGTHTVYYESTAGCIGSGVITITPFEEAVIDSLPVYFCHKDTNIFIEITPPGGILTVDGEPNNVFNPAELGPGPHSIVYGIGIGSCYNEANAVIVVGDPIEVHMPFDTDTLCNGQSTTISADGAGGLVSGNYIYTWDQGLGFGKNQYVTPGTTTLYTVTVEDGCSDPAYGSLTLYVHPTIQTAISTGEAVCFDDTTWASIAAFPPDDYTFIWNSDPPIVADRIESYPTSYFVQIINNTTGCETETSVTLPGYPLIQANFGLSPADDCISTINPTVEILDFSVGGERGYWDFGDSTTQLSYRFGEDLSYTFSDTGNFVITLFIENEGGCFSEFRQEICVKPEHRLYAPNAFTPNYDGKNDFFQFRGVGITKIRWSVYNRWGLSVFEGYSMEDTWDGFYKGDRVQAGAYPFVAEYSTESISGQVMKGVIMVLY